MEIINKVCNKCKIEKPITEFHKQKNGKFGVIGRCKVCISEYTTQYYLNYPKKSELLNNWKIYRESHRKERMDTHHKREEIDPIYKISIRIRSSIKGLFKKRGKRKPIKSEQIIGCSFEFFKSYIESLFEPWMNWENYGNWNGVPKELNTAWDIDHIVPTSTANTEEEVIKLNHYTNLRPLCAYTNRWIKKDRILP